MGSCRTASTPLRPGTVLDRTLEQVTSDETVAETDEMKKVRYRDLIGSLLYLYNTTIPDIEYVVGLLSR